MAPQMLLVLLCSLLLGTHGIIIKQNSSLVNMNPSAPSLSRSYRNIPLTVYAKQVPHFFNTVKPTVNKGPELAASKTVPVRANISTPSVTRLYRNVPRFIYASGEPHKHHTFKPTSNKGQQAAASHFVPVKEEQIVIHNQKGYLKDSYGNSFVTTPQMLAYKMTLPHQYVKLQDLPRHLSQPLTAATSGSFYKNVPKFSYGTPHKLSSIDSFEQTPKFSYGTPHKLTSIDSFEQTPKFSYGSSHKLSSLDSFEQTPDSKLKSFFPAQKVSENLKSFGPLHTYQQLSSAPVTSLLSQASKQKTIYSNKYPHYSSSEEDFERLLKSPHAKHVWHDLKIPKNLKNQETTKEPYRTIKIEKLKSPITSQSKKVPVKAAQTIILETKPPLPQISDFSLLEPLHFDNPIVPQVQHFLPKITYHLPKVDEAKQHHDEYVVKKTMYYDTGVIKNPKPQPEENSAEEDSEEVGDEDSREDDDNEQTKVVRPPSHVKVHVHQSQPSSSENNENPDFEISNKSPNYKETLTQEVIKYENSEESEPKTHSYASHVTSPPQDYAYSSTSKPYEVYVSSNSESHDPVKIVYTNAPEVAQSEPNSSDSSEDSVEDSREKTDDSEETKDHSKEITHHSAEKNNEPKFAQYKAYPNTAPTSVPKKELYHTSKPGKLDTSTLFYLSTPTFNPALMYPKNQKYQQMLSAMYNQMPKPTLLPEYHAKIPRPPPVYASDLQKAVMGSQPSVNPVTSTPQVKYQTVKTPVDNFGIERYVNKPLQDFEQNIQLLPSTNGKIAAPSGQHLGSLQTYNNGFQPSSFFGKSAQQRASSDQEIIPPRTANVREKSQKIIIQDETPNERHTHQEQKSAEVIDDGDDETTEENFEEAYKNSAYGFPAYNKDPEDIEKEIFSPSGYRPQSDSEYDFNETPFDQYVNEGDRFPKSARLTYRDDRDDLKDNYYQEFTKKTPKTYEERKKHKNDYFSEFEHNSRPEAFFDEPLEERKETKKNEKRRATYEFKLQSKPALFAQYRKVPGYEYNYSKSAPRDSFAHASLNKAKASFAEPYWKYGYEPLIIPLLDSELSASSSNLTPNIAKDGIRKKFYKENVYIKKTSTTSGMPAS